MATIKKPAKKMQMGGKATLDKMTKDAGFGSKKLSPDTTSKPSKLDPRSSNKSKNDSMSIEDMLKKSLKKKDEPKVKLLKKGGAVKAKNGKSFPDLNKDGKITKADILKGRGVIAKKGAAVKKKKMQYGGAAASMVPPMMKKGGATKKCKYGCK